MSEYEEAASDFLKRNGLVFSAMLAGNDCPPYCKDEAAGRDMDMLTTFPRKTHIHGKHYRCFITALDQGGRVAFDFWNSYDDEEFNFWRNGRGFSPSCGPRVETRVPFNNQYWDHYRGKHRDPVRVPTAYDLLTCVQKSDPGSFDDFCSD